MRKTKKCLSLFLALLMTLPMLALVLQPVPAQATASYATSDYKYSFLSAMVRDRQTRAYIPNSSTLHYNPSLYCLSGWELERIDPNMFIVDSAVELVDSSQSYVTGYRITYYENFTLPDGTVISLDEGVKVINEFYDAMVADIPEDLDDLTKVILLNNRLCQRTTYDTVAGEEAASHVQSTTPQHIYSGCLIGPALYGTAICSGYANAFKFLCDKVGIPCKVYTVSIASRNDHAIDVVTVDGKQYIVDPTHDDQVNNNFLLCSAYRYNNRCSYVRFADGQVEFACNEEYDNPWWMSKDPSTTFYCNGAFYSFKGLNWYSSDGSRVGIYKNGEQIDRYASFWFDGEYASYSQKRGCSGNAFYFSMPDAIWKFDCRTDTKTVFYKPTIPEGKMLTNFYYDGVTLKYLLTDQTVALDKEAYAAYKADPANYVSVNIYDPDMHNPVEFVEESDCQHSRAVGVKCSLCGTILTPATATGEMGPHQGEWTNCTATCTAAGTESRVCTVCGETETRDVPAKGHDYSPLLAANVPSEENHNVTATCTQEGRAMALTCKDCGYVKPAETLPQTGHSREYFYYNDNAVIQHDFNENWDFGYVTCTRGGTIPGIKCWRCGEIEREPVDYPDGFGHDPVETKPYEAPTCSSFGHEKEITCSRCGTVLQSASSINPLGHDVQELAVPEDHPATCTEDRYVVMEKCVRCGWVKRWSTYTNSKGHIDENGDAICDDCGVAITAETKMRGQSSSGNNDNGGNNQGGNNQGGSSSSSSGNIFDAIRAFFQRIIAFIRGLFSR